MKLSKLLDSPALFLALVLVTLSFSFAWWKSESRNSVPTIPGYSWVDHPDVSVISNATSCCGIPNHDWVETALRNKADVLVISNAEDPELERLLRQKKHPHSKFLVIRDENITKFFGPHDRTSGARIINGRVAAKAEGGIPPTFLFEPIR